MLAGSDPQLHRVRLLLEGKEVPNSNQSGVREELLDAIASRNPARFNAIAARIGQRKIAPDSDWCQDDYLLFLLLLGNDLFGRTLTFLRDVFDVRAKNTNPLPSKINHVFATLYRQEFEVSGELSFLKIPFLHLVGRLRLSPAEAIKAFDAMSVPQLYEQMSPFLKLLTLRAHDLVLAERRPLPTETTGELIAAFEAHAKNLSLHQWGSVIAALPGRWILAGIIVLSALVSAPVLVGAGKALVDASSGEGARERPKSISVRTVKQGGTDLPREAVMIAQAMQRQGPTQSVLITVESDPFGRATPSFSVEVSHPERAIHNAFAFTQGIGEGIQPFTVVPVQRDGGRFRAILPEQVAGQKLSFVLQLETKPGESPVSIGRRVALRPLQ